MKSILIHYLPEIKKYGGWAILMFSGLIIVTLADLYLPFCYKDIVDHLTVNSPENYAIAMNAIKKIAFIFFILWLVWRINDFAIVIFESKAVRDIEIRCFAKIQEQSFRFYSNNFAGALVKKVSRFSHGFEVMTDICYFNFFKQFLVIGITLVIFWQKSLLLGVVFLTWTLFYLIANYLIAVWKMKYDAIAAKADSKVSGALADSFSNYATVKTFAQEEEEIKLFTDVANDCFKKRYFAWNLTNYTNGIQSFFMLFLEVLIFYLAIKKWQQGVFTVGDFIFVQSYLISTFMSLWDFGRNIRNFFTHLANAQEMADIFNQTIEIKDITNAQNLIVKNGEIKFNKVGFAYSVKEKQLFNSLNLTITAGEKIALVGHTGEGKSTIVNLLLRLFDIKSGEILIDKQNISLVTQKSLRKNISLVPQDPVLFHRSIADNIRYSQPEANLEEVIKAAKQAQAHSFINKLSHGYDTLVGERGVKLSGGERQRIAIARAILENAKILVLDEATSSLDSMTEIAIQKAIDNVSKNKTAIIIAHRLSTIKKADRVVVISKGEIVESGTHDDLLKLNGYYAELWSHQVGGFLIE